MDKFKLALYPYISGVSISCGIRQMYNLPPQDPELTVFRVLQHLNAPPVSWKVGFIIFSDRDNSGGLSPAYPGQKLADWIEAKAPGSIIKTSHRLNPNSGNTIRVWVWDLSLRAPLWAWFTENGLNKL